MAITVCQRHVKAGAGGDEKAVLVMLIWLINLHYVTPNVVHDMLLYFLRILKKAQ